MVAFVTQVICGVVEPPVDRSPPAIATDAGRRLERAGGDRGIEPDAAGKPPGRLLVVMAAGLGRLDGLYRELDKRGWQTTRAELDEPLLRWIARGVGIRPTLAAYRRAYLKAGGRLSRTAFAFAYRSRRSARLLEKFAGEFDAVLQIGGMWAPDWPRPIVPFALFCDCTVRLGDGNVLSGVDFPSRRTAQRWYRLERELYHRAGAIFAASHYVRRSLVDDYGVPRERVDVVGEGINLSAPDRLEHRYDGRTLLFVGYEFERKGGPVLLEAFERVRRELPDAELLIAGPRRRPDRLPEGVRWLGVVPRDELARLYERASVFVMPSLFEPFGLVYLEAMEWKLPCVGTAECAMPEIIRDGETGRLVEAGDVAALTTTLIEMLRRPARLYEMGERARRRARERFTWAHVAARVDPGLRRLLGTRSPDPR